MRWGKGWQAVQTSYPCELHIGHVASSDGFSKLWPSLVVTAGYGTSFVFLSLTFRHIPVGAAYSIWSGIGAVLISLVGWLLFNQKLDAPAIVGMGLIVYGVVVLNVFSKVASH